MQQKCFSIRPILFLYYEESLVSSNLNSKLFRFHCVRPNLHSNHGNRKKARKKLAFFDIELCLVLILLCYLLLIVHKKNYFSRNIYVKGLLFNISQGWIISISTYFCRYCIKPHNLVPFCIFLEHFSYTIQCNLDLVTLNYHFSIYYIKSFDLKCHKIDGDISWTMTSRGHYFSKLVTSCGHSQRVTFRGHFWWHLVGTLFSARLG